MKRAIPSATLGLLFLALVAAFAAIPLNAADTPFPQRHPHTDGRRAKFTINSWRMPTARAGKINIVFACDSITACWTGGAGCDIWAKRYASRGAINLSIPSDNAQHLLWRLENGEIAPLHPKMVILLIGANNLGESPEAVAYGVWANVAYIRKTLPNTRVLVQGMFERENPPPTPVST